MRKLNKSEIKRIKEIETIIHSLEKLGVCYERYQPDSSFLKKIRDEHMEWIVEWEIITGKVFDDDYTQ